jgi:hypothetical protein
MADLKSPTNNPPRSNSIDYDENIELRSFPNNIDNLETLIGKMEIEVFSSDPNIDRLTIYQSDIQSILGELKSQRQRAFDTSGESDPHVQRLQQLLGGRLVTVSRKVELLLSHFQDGLVELNRKRDELASFDMGNDPLSVNETSASYELGSDLADQEWSFSKSLNDATQRLSRAIEKYPDRKIDYLPILEQFLKLTTRAISVDYDYPSSGAPPRGPVDTPNKAEEDDRMEARITNLEKFADATRQDLRSVDVRLGKIETILENISQNMATKNDLSEMKISLARTEGSASHMATKADIGVVATQVSDLQSTIMKWIIGTGFAAAGVAIAAARLLP